MLVGDESADKFDSSTLSVGYSQEKFRTLEASLYQVLPQNNSKRTTENSSANARTERIRNVARKREAVRLQEHVRQQFSIRSTDQQHQ